MNTQSRHLYGGIGLLFGFLVVLVLIFSPIIKGQNALEYLDALYNSISKGSAYYIPMLQEESSALKGKTISFTIALGSEKQAREAVALFETAGAQVDSTASELRVTGDLGAVLANSLADADAMYRNDGEMVAKKYGYDERRVLFNWWAVLKSLEKERKAQRQFEAAKMVSLVREKAVETSYNYYEIEPQRIGDRLGFVTLSLVFYVVYTLWYGFAILYIFEGVGLRLGH